MWIISTRCLFVLVLILLPFPTGSDGTDGFPKLDDKEKLKAALEKISKEDLVERGTPIDVPGVMRCYEKNTTCFAAESVKNELRLRNGYKLLGEGCSSDPALNRHLFSPPSVSDLVKYPIWQRHLLDANQPLCSPFKHLQCSKTTAKCECRPGLIWRKESFKNHQLPKTAAGLITIFLRGPRDNEKICIFAMNKPCQKREYPGDEEIDSKSLSPKEIEEGMPIAVYFAIFFRAELFGDGDSTIIGNNRIIGLAIKPPACGDNECSQSLYTQRQRVCGPRDWDKDVISSLEDRLGIEFPIQPGFTCNYEYHRRLYTISDEELSDTDFWAKRKKNLEDLSKSDQGRYCDLRKLSTCRPPKVGEFEGECACIHPFIPTKPTPSRIRPNPKRVKCVLPKEHNKCDMTNEIIKILRNETWTRGAKLLLNKGVEKSMVGVCPNNFTCHAGLDINDEMEIYCTCENGQAGPQCRDKLTKFLMKARVPSFPSDVEDIQEKWKIFNEFNEKAVQFEKIFKMSKGKSCDLNAEAEASTAVERIRRLDKKGTVMTKAQYKKLTDTIVKLTKQHQNGQGLCKRFGFGGDLTCNSFNRTCVTEEQKIMVEACRHLADDCELEGMVVISGKCFCAPRLLGPNISTKSKSRGVVTPPDYFVGIVGVIIFAMK